MTAAENSESSEASADNVLVQLQKAVREHELILRKQEDLIQRLRNELGGVEA